ncbi:beta-ketoacyl-[acyl-carrier-protein] synthase family protein [Metabacillus malikii]|uniref:3-oxoacyl-[acyl-carrier-protein] synthase II n=1 Tax=Metabacillus malikii TaxID=1504265 RepID=A0ABT9Z9Z9_9BACI|nr:beta-ketoacyl-[acyl-carrier-protein] synthase family protein [Metabacillus malikii]MDQ0229079.1 3-oxoacyl-[acyl-carrier-protein] synthase II [Metabacillus malikii]
MKHEVVVTGMGIICANGQNVDEFWRNIQAGTSGIDQSSFHIDGFGPVYAGEVKEISPTLIDTYKLHHHDKVSQFAVIAANEAIQMASLNIEHVDPFRVGIIVGTSLGGVVNGEAFLTQWLEEGLEHADGELINDYPLHAPSDIVAAKLGIKGPKTTISNACAAGSNAIGIALDYIRSGMIDIALVGGADPLSYLSLSGFNSLNALSTGHCSPFSTSDGINIGEGAGFIVLERKDFADARGIDGIAKIYDYSLSADCYHPTAPDPAGSGALQAMKNVLEKANIPAIDVSYINAHGTGTQANDLSEPKAIRSMMKDVIPPISSTKSMTGHMLGAAGLVEAITSILAIRDDVLPPTVNFDERQAKYEMDFVPNHSKAATVDIVLSNSFAFGGNNCSVLFGKNDKDTLPTPQIAQQNVVITGIGAIAGNAENTDDVFKILSGEKVALDKRKYEQIESFTGEISPIRYEKFINPSYVRKMDALSKQAVLTTKYAIKDASLRISKQNSERIGLIFATGTGPLDTVHSFYKKVLLEGPQKASAKLFPNTVMNAAAGHIGVNVKIKGPTSTICAGGVSGINAMHYGTLLIQQDICDQVIVVSSDEFNETIFLGASRMKNFLSHERAKPFDRNRNGLNLGSASVAIVLESESSAKQRDKQAYATISGFGMASGQAQTESIDRKGESWQKAIELSLSTAGLQPDDIQLVSSAASGHKIDALEAKVISSIFQEQDVLVNATKGLFGETHASAGMLGILDTINAFNGTVSSVGNETTDPISKLKLANVTLFNQDIQHAVVNTYSFGGNYASMVLSK